MGRFDALTQLDKKPLPNTPLPEKTAPITAATPPEDQLISKSVITQTNLHANPQTSKDASMQTRKPVNMQAGKSASMQTSKQVNLQTGKQVSLQTGKQIFIEKYSSYLPHEYKKELERIAWETDRKAYEVLIEAVEHFLEHRKQSK